MASSNSARPPEPLNLEDRAHRGENWKNFKREWSYYEIAAGIASKTEKIRVAALLNVIGRDALDMYETFQWDDEGDSFKIAKVLEKFEERCVPARNEIFERYNFFKRNQNNGESLDAYITTLLKLSETCAFGELRESLVRDRLVYGIRDDRVREKLLGKRDLDLDKCIEILKSSELTHFQAKEIANEESQANFVKRSWSKQPVKTKPEANSGSSKSKHDTLSEVKLPREFKDCKFCGRRHLPKKENCPAWKQRCRKCGKTGHFEKVCRSTKVHQVSQEVEYLYINSLAKSKSDQQAFVTFKVNQKKDIAFQIDTGATCNVLPFNEYQRITRDFDGQNLQTTNNVLIMHNKSRVFPRGSTVVQLDRGGHGYRVQFLVVENCEIPLLSLVTSKQLGLVKIIDSDSTPKPQVSNHIRQVRIGSSYKPMGKDQILCEYGDVFEGIGCLPGEYNIEVDLEQSPVIHAPRRIPIAIRDTVKEELEKMEENGIIARIAEPTPWVSSMVVVPKKNNQVRVCIDPRDLNNAIKRCHYPLPTLEEVATRLPKAKVFSVFDAKSGFWQVKLSESSCKLTTFNTPFGRYYWKRMPFGIKSAPEVWQRKAHELIEGLHGVEVIMDDFLVIGCGDTFEEAGVDHDKNLVNFLERARERNLKLNPEKMRLRLKQVPFIGHLLSPQGLIPDPAKIDAIVNMPTPLDVKSLRRALGMINYLAKFLPNLSSTSEVLRRLVQKGADWHWDDRHEKAWNELKQSITEAPVLAFFDPEKEVTIQCDSSQGGLGAVLTQEGKPIHYASRALSKAEKNYAQVEKELLAIVFACERFDQYVYGRSVTVESDHKPLEQIATKPFHEIPKRLQRMYLRLQKYDVKITYKKGEQLFIADALSRAYLTMTDDKHENAVGKEEFSVQLEEINLVAEVPIADQKLNDLRRATAADQTLQKIRGYVENGWPTSRQYIPPDVRPYYSFFNELSFQQGLIFKLGRIVVPQALQEDLTRRLHSSHLGVEGCLRRARESLYWPGMSAQVKDFVSRCSVCKTYQPKQCREPLIPHEFPARPWAKVGVDLFTLENRNYLLTVDYFSNFVEVDYLTSTTSTAVIKKMKEQFSRHGIPEIVFSDNGPQFSCGEFKSFSDGWEFEHRTSSPFHSQSNGKAENAVKTCKLIMKKAALSKSDIHLALLDFRNTPSERDGTSPSQKLFSRRTRTRIPTTGELLSPHVIEKKRVVAGLHRSKASQKRYYDIKTHVLPLLKPGEMVRVRLPGEQNWSLATCSKQVGPRSYEVLCGDRKYRRNRRDLRKTLEYQSDPTKEEPLTSREGRQIPVPKDSIPVPFSGDVPNTDETGQPSLRRSTRVRKSPERFQAGQR